MYRLTFFVLLGIAVAGPATATRVAAGLGYCESMDITKTSGPLVLPTGEPEFPRCSGRDGSPPEVVQPGGPVDSDGDGLTDADEVNLYGTDPYRWDTDLDGFGDGEEIKSCTSPRSPFSWPGDGQPHSCLFEVGKA
jgi:hypothetical protein